MEPKAPNINMEREVLMQLAGPGMGAAYLSQQLREVFCWAVPPNWYCLFRVRGSFRYLRLAVPPSQQQGFVRGT